MIKNYTEHSIFQSDMVERVLGIEDRAILDGAMYFALIRIKLEDIKVNVRIEFMARNTNQSQYLTRMVNRLKEGGFLPSIILDEEFNVLDGRHRTAAYIASKTEEVWALVRRALPGN